MLMLHLLLYYMLVSVARWITNDIADNFDILKTNGTVDSGGGMRRTGDYSLIWSGLTHHKYM